MPPDGRVAGYRTPARPIADPAPPRAEVRTKALLIDALQAEDGLTVRELVERVPLERRAITEGLADLKRRGLITYEPGGAAWFGQPREKTVSTPTITSKQAAVIEVVKRFPGADGHAVARQLGISKSAADYRLEALEKRRLVSRGLAVVTTGGGRAVRLWYPANAAPSEPVDREAIAEELVKSVASSPGVTGGSLGEPAILEQLVHEDRLVQDDDRYYLPAILPEVTHHEEEVSAKRDGVDTPPGAGDEPQAATSATVEVRILVGVDEKGNSWVGAPWERDCALDELGHTIEWTEVILNAELPSAPRVIDLRGAA